MGARAAPAQGLTQPDCRRCRRNPPCPALFPADHCRRSVDGNRELNSFARLEHDRAAASEQHQHEDHRGRMGQRKHAVGGFEWCPKNLRLTGHGNSYGSRSNNFNRNASATRTAEPSRGAADSGPMAKTTTNRSLRLDNPTKTQRRQPVTDEMTEGSRTAGASGEQRRGRKRPGRAASLLSSSQRTRSQRWRDVASGKLKRRANPASRTRSRPSPKNRRAS
jgi:hypothetical protein